MGEIQMAFWRRLDRPGHDAARLVHEPDGPFLEGYAAFSERGPTGLHYRVALAPDWTARSAVVEGHRAGVAFRHELARTEGAWVLDGVAVPGLEDVVHLDFGFTPATNLPQLRHAGLRIGAEAEVDAAWFDVGEETLVRLPQTWRRIAADRYWYRSPTAGYEAVLEVAESGFIVRYPGLWALEREA